MTEGLSNLARRIRGHALSGFHRIGGFKSIAESEWRRRRLLILCYHGVSLHDEHEWNPELFVTPAFLRRRFEILRDGGYTVLPLGESIHRLHDGTLPPSSVVLTFDDGFHNFHKAAVPLLEEFSFPATNYVSTYHCLTQTPIPRISLEYLLWRGRFQELQAGDLPELTQAYNLGDKRQRGQLEVRLGEVLQELHGQDAQQEFLRRIAAILGVDWESVVRNKLFHLMNTQEVADIAHRGFDVQLHTHHHRTPRTKTEFFHELMENQRILEELSGQPAKHFCYPSGDADSMFLPWLRELKVETATTTAISSLAQAKNDWLLLPRYVDTMAKSEVVFESWLSGAGLLFSPRGLLGQIASRWQHKSESYGSVKC